ncbi:hypothetical protein FQK01_24660 [Xanthomonas vasicola]|uniref:Bacteriocin n=2 Tax=Xanthomonas vasicola TaxID=56459 RepID=A0ABD7S2P5_XANVA|nr:hypothetical protein FQK01_24660 [Xanthomonas vasicola]
MEQDMYELSVHEINLVSGGLGVGDFTGAAGAYLGGEAGAEGAMIGLGIGGPIGGAIGAAIGFGIGYYIGRSSVEG